MRYLITAALLVTCIKPLFGQQSVGFSDPEDIQPLLDYRLPDWGHSNFYLDFGLNGSGIDQKNSFMHEVRKRAVLNISPAYDFYRESEERIFRFGTSANLDYSGRISKTSNGGENEMKDKDLYTQFNVSVTLREYVGKAKFIYGRGMARLNYQSSKNTQRDDGTLTDKQLRYNRIFSATPRLGFGFGRIRNVNPVIRAIRLKERASELNTGTDFSNQDILSAADQFSKYDGYRQTYDRPSKQFWGDMDQGIESNLSSLDTFDMLFLTDVLDEAIGTRLEGWEVIGGVQFDYQNDLYRTEDPLAPSGGVTRNPYINKEIGGFISGRWYKNTSLRQQWGLFGDAVLSYPHVEDENPSFFVQRRFVIQGGINWLWNITDRILIQSSLGNRYQRTKEKYDTVGPDTSFNTWHNEISLNSNINFYVENQLQVNFSLTPSLIHQGTSESNATLDNRLFRWQAGIGMRYYFNRNLF